MHSRRFACLLLGMWLAGGLFMAWVATENFRSVDRLLTHPNPVAVVALKALGPGPGKLLLRYQVSEQNRWYFESWELIQLFAGAFLFFFLLFGTNEDKFSLLLVLLMMVIVLLQRFLLTPEIISVGRTLDFVPLDMPTTERSKFWVLHGGYSGTELLKWGMQIALAVKLIARRPRRSGDVRQEFDLIDKANHRHVDR